MGKDVIEKLIRDGVLSEQDVIDYINGRNAQRQIIKPQYSTIKDGVLVKFDKRDLVLGHYDLPEFVTKIGVGAFLYCEDLKSITFHSKVEKLGIKAFCCSGLRTITIPSSVKYVGKEVCSCCKDLRSVEIEEGINYISDNAFSWCVNLSDVTIPSSVRNIGVASFRGCDKLKKVDLPQGVRYIGERAFKSCKSLTEITITKTLKGVGASSFEGCPVENIFKDFVIVNDDNRSEYFESTRRTELPEY